MTGTPSKDRAEGRVVPDYIADAITEAYGERCEDFAAGCHCCEAWSQYDDVVSLRAQADEAETATRKAFAEGMKRGFELGFSATAEGYNGEYPFEGVGLISDPEWCAMRDRVLSGVK